MNARGRATQWPQNMRDDVVLSYISWNMNGSIPPKASIADMFHSLDSSVNMVIVGTQESVNSIERSIIFRSKSQWISLLKGLLPGWSQVVSHEMQAVHLILFVKPELDAQLSCIQTTHLPTGPGGLASKGCVGVGFCIRGVSFLVLVSHFTAYQEQVAARNADYRRTVSELPLKECSHRLQQPRRPVNPLSPPRQSRRQSILTAISPLHFTVNDQVTTISRFDVVLWAGDLNYRVDLDREDAEAFAMLNDVDVLLDNDQLRHAMVHDGVFEGFTEPGIDFQPTYKYDKGTHKFDSSGKRRIPSYTDRILYKARASLHPTVHAYQSHHSITWSDHKPVELVLRVCLPDVDHLESPSRSISSTGPSPRDAGRPRRAWTTGGVEAVRNIDERRSSVCCGM